MDITGVPTGMNWSASLYLQGDPEGSATNNLEFKLPYEESAVILLKVNVPEYQTITEKELSVRIASLNSNGSTYQSDEITFTITVE